MASNFLFLQRLRLLKKNSFPREFLKFTLYVFVPVCIFFGVGQPVLKQKLTTMLLDDNFRREYAKLTRQMEDNDRVRDSNWYEQRRKVHEERVEKFLEKQMDASLQELNLRNGIKNERNDTQ